MPEQLDSAMTETVFLCNSDELLDSAQAVSFDVRHGTRNCPAFAIRFEGHVHAYLNRCAHVPMEMDFVPNRFFDASGQYLICATHGAMYQPQTGACRGGPCRGGLVKIEVSERDGVVHWHTGHNLNLPES
jgi:nitrite reductase/ring-hydroxylating ferredoxin subunit